MIAAPLNDRPCLDQVTAIAVRSLDRADVRAFAAQFRTTADLAAWIRGLAQRDDKGDPADGPRIACDVSQRVRVFPHDPNCVERALLYLVTGHHIDPAAVLRLVTVQTRAGRHTLPVENGNPVLLDPRATRNEVDAAFYRQRRNATYPRRNAVTEGDAMLLDWIARIAEEPAARRAGELGRLRVAGAVRAFRHLAAGVPLPRLRASKRVKRDIGFALDFASRVAPLWGPEGVAGVIVARTALGALGLLPPKRAAPTGMDRDELAAWAKGGASGAASQPCDCRACVVPRAREAERSTT